MKLGFAIRKYLMQLISFSNSKTVDFDITINISHFLEFGCFLQALMIALIAFIRDKAFEWLL